MPSALTVTVASALPLGDSRSVRVTVSLIPAGSATLEETLPLTVSCLARVAVAGASTVIEVVGVVGASRTRSEYTPE